MCFEKMYAIYEEGDKNLKIYRVTYSSFTKNILKVAIMLACAKKKKKKKSCNITTFCQTYKICFLPQQFNLYIN